MLTRRDILAGLGAGLALSPTDARAIPLVNVQRSLSLQMARAFALQDDQRDFRRLFDVQEAFLGLDWPATGLVVIDAMSALRRVLHGDVPDRTGYRRVIRRPLGDGPIVVFSDHHALPATNRQAGLWLANRDAYATLLRHYGTADWTVVENGDVEDLVIFEPETTVAMYDELIRTRKGLGRSRRLLEWYREDPEALIVALRDARRHRRRRQLEAIVGEPGNRGYYDALRELAAAGRLVRLAGNHDYDLQSIGAPEAHLVPDDILVLTDQDAPQLVLMHGHQFDQATHPGVATLYGEVVSECLGVWYQGPDRTWSAADSRRIIEGGFPNRLATHHDGHRSVSPTLFLSALLSPRVRDDEDWARAWESLFGHPIAWEYGARDWQSAVKGHLAHPGDLVDQAMVGRQFFKFRHLDEFEILRGLGQLGIDVGLVLGHSHEIRSFSAGPRGQPYYNSGAVGRFEGLIWALEIEEGQVTVVGWHDEGRQLTRYAFETVEDDLFSYFVARPTASIPAGST